jgi:PAS domain S-box-containing protein
MRKTQPAPRAPDRGRSSARSLGTNRAARSAADPTEPMKLIHEFQVLRIELTMQNQELERSRDHAEGELARHVALLEFAPIGFLSVTRSGIIRQVNVAAARLLGEVRAHLVGRPLASFLSPGSRGNLAALLANAGEGRTGQLGEVEIPQPGLSPRLIQLTSLGIDDDRQYTLAATDLTERRRAEQRYRSLFERSREALLTLAPPNWEHASANAAALSLFGAGQEAEVVGQTPWALSPPEGLSSEAKLRAAFECALREGSHTFAWTYQRVTGERFRAQVELVRVEAEGQLLELTIRPRRAG